MKEFLAHSGGHRLADHLQAVAHLAANFAAGLTRTNPGDATSARWAELAGLWHDLGKYRPGFQRYLAQSDNPDAHIEGRVSGREKTSVRASSPETHRPAAS